MAWGEDDFYFTTAKVDHLAVVEILDLSCVVAHVVRNNRHVACIQIDLRERTYAACMVTVGMGQHHGDRLGSNLCHNLVQLRYACSCINQKCAVVPLNEVERLVIDPVSVSYPCVFVELTEHYFIVLVNHFAAKVTAVDIYSLCLDRNRYQAKQHGCNHHVCFHIYKDY